MQQCSDGIMYEVAVLFLHLNFEEIRPGMPDTEDQLTLGQISHQRRVQIRQFIDSVNTLYFCILLCQKNTRGCVLCSITRENLETFPVQLNFLTQ